AEVDVAHIGNFAAELFCGQGHLGGLFAQAHPAFAALPASRHEAACASGSVAVLAASADLESGRYRCAAVLGIEQMRNVPGEQAAQLIGGPAMWAGHECRDVRFPWPHLFSRLGDVYEERYGLDRRHLVRIAEINFGNAKRNPNAQTRAWRLDERHFAEDDERNPVIEGRIRKHDCGQITDGAALVVLAGPDYAREYAHRHGRSLEELPRILGFGHRTAPITFDAKIAASRAQPYVMPHIRAAVLDAYRRAELSGPDDLDGFEVHDCFTTTEYLAIDHLGLTPPGQSWRAIESGRIDAQGKTPINPSGGLIGLGHPVGATGVRMVLDAYRQVTGTAGDYQVEGARRFGTLNIGGSGTTVVSFVIGRR
ncbi:MAG: acetyl-CoA acetyltransferase, partial [Steroidobacteraceae bacterium]|nr:acetyl-CoA acetyltransferase [Steroidobacteraceae bacterium]